MKRKREDERTRDLDELRWYEILLCCCKCRGEYKSCLCTTCLYFVPIITLLSLAGACITAGLIWRQDCSYKRELPYWLIVSSITPLFLFVSIKGIKEEYYGVTLYRILSLCIYIVFTSWIILGTSWIVDTHMKACSTCCSVILKYFALAVLCAHWLFFLISTAAQIFILTRMCCCCTENAIKPLKRNIDIDDEI